MIKAFAMQSLVLIRDQIQQHGLFDVDSDDCAYNELLDGLDKVIEILQDMPLSEAAKEHRDSRSCDCSSCMELRDKIDNGT